MPSPLHDAVAWAVPRVRPLRGGDASDPAGREGRPDRGLPTGLVPAFARRYQVTTTRTGGPVGFPVHVVRPRGRSPRAVLYYLHGGGYVEPTDPYHVRWALRMARAIDAELVVPDYPLAPAHTWHDSHRALVDDLAARTASGRRVVVAGDSAGGGLALALTQSVRRLRGHLPGHLVLLSPWVDLTLGADDPATAALDDVDPWLSLARMERNAAWWAGSPADRARPEVSPGLADDADLAGLPPTLVLCGTRDLLLPGCRRLADRAAAAGAPLTYLEAPDLIHVFALLPLVPEAGRARRLVLEFLDGLDVSR